MRGLWLSLVLVCTCLSAAMAAGESCDTLRSWPRDKMAKHVLDVAGTPGDKASVELARMAQCFVPVVVNGSPKYTWDYRTQNGGRRACETWGEILHRAATFHKSANFEVDSIAAYRDLDDVWSSIRDRDAWPSEPVEYKGPKTLEGYMKTFPRSRFFGTMEACVELFGGFHIKRKNPRSPFCRIIKPIEVIGTPADTCAPVRDAVDGPTLFQFMQAAFGSHSNAWLAELATHMDAKLAALAKAVLKLEPKGDWASIVLRTLQCVAPVDRANNGNSLHKVANCGAVQHAFTGFAHMVALHEMTQHGTVDNMLRYALESVYDREEPDVMMEIREVWDKCLPKIPRRELGTSRRASPNGGGVRVTLSVDKNIPKDESESDDSIYTPIFCYRGKHTDGMSVRLEPGESVELAFAPSQYEEPMGMQCTLSDGPGRTRSYMRNGRRTMCSIQLMFRKWADFPHVMRVDNIVGSNCPYRWVDRSPVGAGPDNRYHFHLEMKKVHPEIAQSVEAPKLPRIAETDAGTLYKQLADWDCAHVRALTPAQFRTLFHRLAVDDKSPALEFMRHQLHGVRKMLQCARGVQYEWDSEWVEGPKDAQCDRMWQAVNEAAMVFDLRAQSDSFSQNGMELIIEEWRNRKSKLTGKERAIQMGDLPEYDQSYKRKDGKPLTLEQWEKINDFVDAWLDTTKAIEQCNAEIDWSLRIRAYPTRPELYMAFTFVNKADVDLDWFEVAPVYGSQPNSFATHKGKVSTVVNQGKLAKGKSYVQLMEPDGRMPQSGIAEVIFTKARAGGCDHSSATVKRLGMLPTVVYNDKEDWAKCEYGWFVSPHSTLDDVVIEYRKRTKSDGIASMVRVQGAS